jgi:uncharacterized RDD family membrane protein YckC
MDCLRCQNEVVPGKALCATCLEGKPVLTDDTKKVQTAMLQHRKIQEKVYEFDYAGFWLRAIAAIIDGFVVGALQNAIWFTAFAFWGDAILKFLLFQSTNSFDASNTVVRSLAGIFWFYFIPVIIYYGLSESSRWQGSPGKLLLGLQVTDLDGNRLSFFRGSLRALSRFSNLISILPGIGFLLSASTITLSSFLYAFGASIFFIPYSYAMAGFTLQKQAFHDKIASTLVIRGPSFSRKRVLIGMTIALWILVLSFVFAYSNQISRSSFNGVRKVLRQF